MQEIFGKKRKLYQGPTIEIVTLSVDDVVATSPDPNVDDSYGGDINIGFGS